MATKLTLVRFPQSEILIINAFLKEEDSDNRRFLTDCETWFGRKVLVLQDEKYGASAREVWRKKRYIKGLAGAPCSAVLKRELLTRCSQPGDINVIGFTLEEEDRLDDLRCHFPDEAASWSAPLIEAGLTHEDCLAIVDRAGIQLPRMYRKGYKNANCIGCPKGGQAYWQNIREDFPADFQEVYEIQKDIGPGANFLRLRSGPHKGERFSLAELPPGRGDMNAEPDFRCSFFCELTTQEIS